MPMIQASLKEAGLPEDLAWIPMIESGFKADALSKARALGLWQFIASTGQKFSLKRDTYVDERLDPEKSTIAAIAYLKELHQIFGDWTTVLAGYNCGEGRVLQKIRSQKINYLDNFWDLFQMLPYETARYVPRFLATLHILKDPAKYGFDLEELDKPVAFETVTITKAVQLKAVAQAVDATEKELADLNPELRHKSTPPSTYVLRVPEGKGNLLLAGIDKLPKYTPPSSAYASHTVRSGETLSDIAVRYHTSVSKIALANNIRKQDFIRIGQKLKVPLSGTSLPSTAPVSTAKLSSDGKYRVQQGDSLWMIARRFNTNTQRLQQVNGLKNTVLQIGQVLVIPQ
jgi:membrane-bound lytic murein transglycosylase D